ncbi:alcohol dehydrogenase catalytic domain-containing protein [Turicibacter sanguinis]|uniref:alcohol dehydrogenase catalytic domain-containing protein n=1 Tax=Turicibacter sanguinis TaxID=154288 RepID=UPI001896DB09
MLSKGFKIVAPKIFELDIEDIQEQENHVIVRINYAAICKADLRYYMGQRDERLLGLKYPMRLIHEATGIVLKDPQNKFSVGDEVVLVPNICACNNCEFQHVEDCSLGENYCPLAKFASSNYDGFSAECISYPYNHLVKFNPNIVKSENAVFSELISVCIASIRRIPDIDNKVIGIWGDGILGYILTQVLKEIGQNVKIINVGKHFKKLETFDSDEIYISGEIPKNLKLDLAFECIGGKYAETGINEIIEHVKFGSDIVLTGVSENGSLINTRRILEKAVRITGSTRSNVSDFKRAIQLFESDRFKVKINDLIISENIIENIVDYYDVFEKESSNILLGKHILKFNI